MAARRRRRRRPSDAGAPGRNRARSPRSSISSPRPSNCGRRMSGRTTRVRARGSLRVEVDGQLEPVGDPLAEVARQLDALVDRRFAQGTKGMTSTAPIRGCWPCVGVHVDACAVPLRRRLPSPLVTASAGPANVRTLRLWSGSEVRSSRWTPASRAHASGDRVNHLGPTAFAEVGNALDQRGMLAASLDSSRQAHRSRSPCQFFHFVDIET